MEIKQIYRIFYQIQNATLTQKKKKKVVYNFQTQIRLYCTICCIYFNCFLSSFILKTLNFKVPLICNNIRKTFTAAKGLLHLHMNLVHNKCKCYFSFHFFILIVYFTIIMHDKIKIWSMLMNDHHLYLQISGLSFNRKENLYMNFENLYLLKDPYYCMQVVQLFLKFIQRHLRRNIFTIWYTFSMKL